MLTEYPDGYGCTGEVSEQPAKEKQKETFSLEMVF